MEPCSFHERALLIERHLQKLRKLKYDFMLLEIKRKRIVGNTRVGKMFETMQDLDINNNNAVYNKLRFVKLVFITLTLGFSLTLTVVSNEGNVLSKLGCNFEPELTVISETRLCKNDVRFNLSSGLYATPCKVSSVSHLIFQRFTNDTKTSTVVSLNSFQWEILKQVQWTR